jgi:hypothetical protein
MFSFGGIESAKRGFKKTFYASTLEATVPQTDTGDQVEKTKTNE